MKKRIPIMLLAATLILGGCTDVEELPGSSESVSESVPVEGSMIVSLGTGSASDEAEVTSTKSETMNAQTSVMVSGDEAHKSQTTVDSTTGAVTTAANTTAAAATQATASSAVTSVAVTSTKSQEQISKELEEEIRQEMLDGNYVKATVMMEENSQALTDPSFEVTKIQMWYYFNEVAESYYMAAEEYYNEQVKLGNKCATGFEGYNMVNSTLDAGVISDRVPEEYAEAAERVYIKCTDSNGIYVRIPVCEYVSSYPNNLNET